MKERFPGLVHLGGATVFVDRIALEETLLAVLDRDGLTHIIADDPRLGIKLLMELVLLLSQRLRAATGSLVRRLGPEPGTGND